MCNGGLFFLFGDLKLDWRLSDESPTEDCGEEEKDPVNRQSVKCKVFLGFTSNLISSGVRDTVRYLVQHHMVSGFCVGQGVVHTPSVPYYLLIFQSCAFKKIFFVHNIMNVFGNEWRSIRWCKKVQRFMHKSALFPNPKTVKQYGTPSISCASNAFLFYFMEWIILTHYSAGMVLICFQVDVVVTTAGGIEEDLIKCLAPTYKGDFSLPGAQLRSKGLNRIGNLLVPNANYCKFEDWIIPIFDKMLEEQTMKVVGKSCAMRFICVILSIFYWRIKISP